MEAQRLINMGVRALFTSFVSPNPENEYTEIEDLKIEDEEVLKALQESNRYIGQLIKQSSTYEVKKDKKQKTKQKPKSGYAKIEEVKTQKPVTKVEEKQEERD